LTYLSDDILSFPNLKYLFLDDNPVREVPAQIYCLENLVILSLDGTEITKIPREISKLREVRTLSLSRSPIKYIADEASNLEHLTSFWMQHCGFDGFPEAILKCKTIETLVLQGNNLRSVPEAIGDLSKLRFLALDDAGLSEIPDVCDRWPQLTSLYLAGNSISKLPPSMRSLTKLETLTLERNPLPIPPEILGSKPQNILDFYFTSVVSTAPKVPLNEAKMVIVGQGGVGKTSLVKRLIGEPYNPVEDTTRGIWISPWDIGHGQDRLKINIWDFGGQEIMHATHQFFLTKRTLYILVLDSRQGEQESRLEYWLKIIQSFGGTSPIIIVCNKSDESRLTLDETGLTKKYSSSVVGFAIAVSCKSGDGIDILRDMILREVRKLDHLRDLFLTTWIAIKDELDSMRDKRYDYISFDEYERICKRHGVIDPISQKTLVSFLHDLGVVLNFPDPTLEGTNILSPVWVTGGVYRILTWHLEGGILKYDQLKEILDPEKYPPRQHLFILGMMKKFELCFEFDDATNLTYLIPDLLPKNEPDTGSWNDALQFQYHYEVLPSSVISRFIVRMNPFISNRTYWRNGVVISKDGNRALVKADLEDRKIFIHVSGRPARQRVLMDVIRAEFERIHATIPQLIVAEKVPMPDEPSVMVDYDHLLNLLELGEITFVPEKSKRRYNVRALLEGIETDERRNGRRDRSPGSQERLIAKPVSPAPTGASLWKVGAFLLTALVVCVGILTVAAYILPAATFPVVIIGTMLVLCLIFVFIALMTGKLSEGRAVILVEKTLGRLSLVRTSDRKRATAG
jgi:internalin A